VKNYEHLLLRLGGMCLLCLVWACGSVEPGFSGGKPKILVSHSLLAEPVDLVLGKWAEVKVLIPNGVDPHSFRPLPKDLLLWGQADLLVAQGLQFEGGMSSLFQGIQQRKQLILLEEWIPVDSLLLIKGGAPDPHIWFDPLLWKYSISQLIVQLAGYLNISEEQEWREKLQEWESDIDALHARLTEKFLNNGDFYISEHLAFGYLGNRYGLQFHSVRGNTPHAEFGLYRLRHLIHNAHAASQANGRIVVVNEAGIAGRGLRRLREILNHRSIFYEQTMPMHTDALGLHHTSYISFMKDVESGL